jgi:hypothetical protein
LGWLYKEKKWNKLGINNIFTEQRTAFKQLDILELSKKSAQFREDKKSSLYFHTDAQIGS